MLYFQAQYTVDQIGITSVVNVTKRRPSKKFRPNFWQRLGQTGTPNMVSRGSNVTIQSGVLSQTSVVVSILYSSFVRQGIILDRIGIACSHGPRPVLKE